MALARSRAEWARTTNLMALIANVNRDPKRPAYSPRDFDPTGVRPQRREMQADVSILKDVFIHGRLPDVCRREVTG